MILYCSMLGIGDTAPVVIEVLDSDAKKVSLQMVMDQNPGKYIVLYFYPKDDTPGCTTEACNFRDATAQLEELGAVVIGVSKDDHASHQKFISKYTLSFPLWADTDHVLMDAFGVWGERSFMGRKYFGTSRSTFVISPTGKIVAVWEKVKPATHAQEVIDFLKTVV